MQLPNDPIILLSFVNTQLRDHYDSLDELAGACQVNPQELTDKLAAVGYHYDRKHNQFH